MFELIEKCHHIITIGFIRERKRKELIERIYFVPPAGE